MSQSSILLPCAAMALLTGIVWVVLYVERLGEMRRRRIEPQSLATARQAGSVLEHVNAADNFRNLFEVPVLFYALCLALGLAGLATPGFVLAAWAFVGLRAVHSLIHVTYNRVMHRFIVYALSSILLFGTWLAFLLVLLGWRTN